MKILGISSILGSVNFVVTILKMKHPDLPLMKIPLFAWGILIQSVMIIVSMPTFLAAMIMMYTDRLGVSGFFNPAMGGDPLAYQHLFWFTFVGNLCKCLHFLMGHLTFHLNTDMVIWIIMECHLVLWPNIN